MAEKLERIFEYRVLLTKARELQIPLTEQQRARLERLHQQLLQQVPSCDPRDPYTAVASPLPVQYICGGRFSAGLLRNISGAGLAIATPEPPELGQRLMVHIREPQHGLEYVFPTRVVSRVVKGVASVGLAFEGLPSQNRIGGRSSGVWRPQGAAPTEGKKGGAGGR